MPSLVMYLAIAKKHMEKHSEENAEEFTEGILAPDRKRHLKAEKDKFHYRDSSHRPDLDRYCQEQGLKSSYNRGYFLNLLTDYLFYNHFLQEYSSDIFHDFRRMNQKIEEKYDVHVPKSLEGRVRYEAGELKVLDEETVYSFIDLVGQIDLEKYREQVTPKENKLSLKLVGLKEGLLYQHNHPNFFNSHDEIYFYGFENYYGVVVQRVIGYAETDGAQEGLYQVSPIGIAVRPSKVLRFDWVDIAQVREKLTSSEQDFILKACEQSLKRPISKDISFHFQKISQAEIKVLLKIIQNFPERVPHTEVTNKKLNIDYITKDSIEIE